MPFASLLLWGLLWGRGEEARLIDERDGLPGDPLTPRRYAAPPSPTGGEGKKNSDPPQETP